MGLLDKSTFQWLFTIGFVVFAIAVTLLSQILQQSDEDSDQK